MQCAIFLLNLNYEKALEDFVHCDAIDMSEMFSACGEWDPDKRCRMFFRVGPILSRTKIGDLAFSSIKSKFYLFLMFYMLSYIYV